MNKTSKAGGATSKGGVRVGAGRPKKEGRKISLSLSNEALELCELTGQKVGANRTTVIEMAVREFADKRGVKVPAASGSRPTA